MKPIWSNVSTVSIANLKKLFPSGVIGFKCQEKKAYACVGYMS